MKVRTMITSATLVGAMAFGAVAGVAGAQTTAPETATAPSTAHPRSCEDATARLAEVDARIEAARTRITKAETARDKLVAKDRTELAARLTTRIDAAEARLATIGPKLDKVRAALAERCAAPQP